MADLNNNNNNGHAVSDVRVGDNRYRLSRPLGKGSFGEVFKAIDLTTREVVAVKLEQITCAVPQLIFEARVMKYLHHDCPYTVGIPAVRWYGSEGDYNILIMDMLGPSLLNLFTFCEKKFSSKTTVMLAIQALSRLEYIHAKSFIHRDIKPENFMMGIGKRAHHVYAIDFGLAKKYKDTKTGRHISMKEGKSLTGTARYVSVWTHLGIEQSRRDDLESLAYMLVYFAKGTLPWVGVKGADKQQKHERISEKKASTTPEALCRALPPPLLEYLSATRKLAFDEEPNYEGYRERFFLFLKEQRTTNDYNFDWLTRGKLIEGSADRSSIDESKIASSRIVSVRNSLADDRSGNGEGLLSDDDDDIE